MLRPKDYRTDGVLGSLGRQLDSPTILKNCRKRAKGLAGNTALEKACLLIEQLVGQTDGAVAAHRRSSHAPHERRQ
jgi:hypothetical protein